MLPSPMPPLALGDCLSGNDLNAFAIASQTHTHTHTHTGHTDKQTEGAPHTARHDTSHVAYVEFRTRLLGSPAYEGRRGGGAGQGAAGKFCVT